MTEEQLNKQLENIKMMGRYFQSNAEVNREYLPEYTASKSINDILLKNDVLGEEDLDKICKIFADIDMTAHKNDCHWYDYKIHINSLLGHHRYPGIVL